MWTDNARPAAPSSNPNSTAAGNIQTQPSRGVFRLICMPISGRHDQEHVHLLDREHGGREQLGGQQVPAGQRCRKEQPHDAHFTVVHHRQGRLHPAEQKHHSDETGNDVLEIVHALHRIGAHHPGSIPFVEPIPAANTNSPERWTDKGGQQAPALLEEFHDLAGGEPTRARSA